MDENEKTKLKNALRQLIGGVGIIALIILSIWFLDTRGPAFFSNPFVGYIAAMMIPGMVMGFRGLAALFDLLTEHYHMNLDGKNILISAGLCVMGTGMMGAINEQIGGIVGAGMLIGGLWLLSKSVGTALVLRRDGETVHAVITEITHDAPSRGSGITYTVICRAGDRKFKKRTNMPLDASYIGKKVAVSVSAGTEGIYFVDLSRFYPADPKPEVPSDPVTEPETESEPEPEDDTAFAPADPESPEAPEEDARVPERAAFTPMDWETTKKRCLKIPYVRIVLLTVAMLYFGSMTSKIDNLLSESSPVSLIVLAYLVTLMWVILWLTAVLGQVRRYLFFRYGRQVRAQIRSAKLTSCNRDGDSVYKVTCGAEDGEYAGRMVLRLTDPALSGKWVTVFVSRRNPKRYIIEGTTVGGEC